MKRRNWAHLKFVDKLEVNKKRGASPVIYALLFLAVAVCGCSEGITQVPPQKPATIIIPDAVKALPVVPNDSIVIAQIISIRPLAGIFLWQVELDLLNSLDIQGYTNMTKANTGQALIARTRENMDVYEIGDKINGHLSVKGDESGTFYYLSEINKER